VRRAAGSAEGLPIGVQRGAVRAAPCRRVCVRAAGPWAGPGAASGAGDAHVAGRPPRSASRRGAGPRFWASASGFCGALGRHARCGAECQGGRRAEGSRRPLPWPQLAPVVCWRRPGGSCIMGCEEGACGARRAGSSGGWSAAAALCKCASRQARQGARAGPEAATATGTRLHGLRAAALLLAPCVRCDGSSACREASPGGGGGGGARERWVVTVERVWRGPVLAPNCCLPCERAASVRLCAASVRLLAAEQVGSGLGRGACARHGLL